MTGVSAECGASALFDERSRGNLKRVGEMGAGAGTLAEGRRRARDFRGRLHRMADDATWIGRLDGPARSRGAAFARIPRLHIEERRERHERIRSEHER